MNKKRTLLITLFITLSFIIINFFPLPYYVTSPGMAKELDDVIKVENGYTETGDFMLTTVSIGKATIFSFLFAKLKDYYEVEPKEAIRYEDETDEEYHVRQLYLMESSKENALQVAFEKAGKSVEVTYNGIYVLRTLEGTPAASILRPGDRIVAIDGHSFQSTEEFTTYVQQKDVGDVCVITFIREGEKLTKELTIQLIPTIQKPGIGITLVDDKTVITDPKVTIDTDQIGGPSAGLMFSLELYNQLTEDDLTKGYLIAGTGTINEKGEVGPIGGIDQKVVAAHKAGAEIFFAPREGGKKGSNYEVAKETAKDIDTNMKIVPVDTFEEALTYLKHLKPKKDS
ncbi:SepM family pheromone-processing serine protease [Fervidibacillus halotolerans]|uniref:endopeptidase La n=1 Tax=Fervidibacillus halotolerans TaxID=2980027 RepID=A0A9E8M295_9BACI|nr:SepM family pheromone-processing serine protease [Fervidibacillus halotolerans]WAA13702.1 PDZ domain-containing protein [Fervidibacillus halotolerans]